MALIGRIVTLPTGERGRVVDVDFRGLYVDVGQYHLVRVDPDRCVLEPEPGAEASTKAQGLAARLAKVWTPILGLERATERANNATQWAGPHSQDGEAQALLQDVADSLGHLGLSPDRLLRAAILGAAEVLRVTLIALALVGCYSETPIVEPDPGPELHDYGCEVLTTEPSGARTYTWVSSCGVPDAEFAAAESCAGLERCVATCVDLATVDPAEDWPECPGELAQANPKGSVCDGVPGQVQVPRHVNNQAPGRVRACDRHFTQGPDRC